MSDMTAEQVAEYMDRMADAAVVIRAVITERDRLLVEWQQMRAERDRLRAALEWYGEQSRLARRPLPAPPAD